MDRQSGLSSLSPTLSSHPSLSPEWLSFSPKDNVPPIFTPFQDYSRSHEGSSLSQNSSPKASRMVPPPQFPNKFIRSKSTPGLFDTQAPEPQKTDVFIMIKEKNTFEKNFPTLGSGSSSKSNSARLTPNTTPPNGTSPRDSNNPWGNKGSTASTSSTPSSSRTSSFSSTGSAPCIIVDTSSLDDATSATSSPRYYTERMASIQEENTFPTSDRDSHLKGLVPTLAISNPPKLLRNRELLNSGKKVMMFGKGREDTFRKASSEPMLPLSPAYQEKYAKLIAKKTPERKEHSAENSATHTPREEKPKPPPITITDFYSNLLNKEEQKKNLKLTTFEESYEEQKQKEELKIKPKPSEEDEERFLRGLGWVPDEEDHVPELTDNEISELRNGVIAIRELNGL